MSTFVNASQASAASAGEVVAPGRKGSTTATHAESNRVSNGTPVLPDGYPADLEIPIRYVKGMEYDMVEARRRWIATLEWRKEENVDTILSETNPYFDVIKKYYPHFYYKQARNGSMIYYEIPGQIDLSKLKENGLDLDALCRHYIYITEYLWNELDKNPEAKLLTCMDMKGTKLSMFAGEVKEFLLRSAKMIGAHYPERSYKIFILNAPWWFNLVWKVVSPFVHPNTKKKVVVCGGNFLPQLSELVDLENVPTAIGGLDPTPPLESPQELMMREHIVDTLKGKNMEMKPVKKEAEVLPWEMFVMTGAVDCKIADLPTFWFTRLLSLLVCPLYAAIVFLMKT